MLPTEKLSPHFTFGEMVHTDVRLPNDPPEDAIAALRALCLGVLEPVRLGFGAPVVVSSGFRSPAVNLRVGGQPSSQHLEGEAADFHVVGFDHFTVARFIAERVPFDQLILENVDPTGTRGWVHCSFRGHGNGLNRRMILAARLIHGRMLYRVIRPDEIPHAGGE